MTDRRPLTRVARGLGVAVTAVTAGVLWTARPQAQPRPPIAIVGARIVDGSGNEPFTGTIVVSGGRISAVGRQVEPPADARDDRRHRQGGPARVHRDRLRAPLLELGRRGPATAGAACSRAGVTTAAAPEGDRAGRRPRRCRRSRACSRRSPRIPRRAPRRCRPASANCATARSRSRSPTIARAGVAAVRSAATRGSRSSALVREDGGVDVAAATAARADAARSGDRDDRRRRVGAGPAVGSRAAGARACAPISWSSPAIRSVSLDALAQVEHVFLGGVDVDRAALMRPPPEPAAPTAAAPTAAAAPPARPRHRRRRRPADARAARRGRRPRPRPRHRTRHRRGGDRHAASQLRARRHRIRRPDAAPGSRRGRCRHRGARRRRRPAARCAARRLRARRHGERRRAGLGRLRQRRRGLRHDADHGPRRQRPPRSRAARLGADGRRPATRTPAPR